MDETTSSLADWFSNTVQSVGSQVAQTWAENYSRNENPVVNPAAPPARIISTSTLASNPLAWLVLALLGFGVFKLARG